jgi:lactam utilization protein B
VHGDTPGAVDSARRLRSALETAGWHVVTVPEAVFA